LDEENHEVIEEEEPELTQITLSQVVDLVKEPGLHPTLHQIKSWSQKALSTHTLTHFLCDYAKSNNSHEIKCLTFCFSSILSPPKGTYEYEPVRALHIPPQ
jgi:hypothetical protein